MPKPELTELVAKALLLLGSERAWVVHGADGLDELSTTGHTKVSECRDGAVHTFYVHPADFGVPKAAAAHAGGRRRRRERGHRPRRPGRAQGAGARRGGASTPAPRCSSPARSASVREGLRAAEAAIDSGAAKATLERMARCSQEGAGA